MRILIVNDDSVSASGLIPLIRFCQTLGDVTTVVPKQEQSGKSHGIELHKPYEIRHIELKPGIWAYTVDSTPADCVRYAVLGLKKEYDLVVSGINRGFNMGTDLMYSGTVGAICEASLLGINAIALSTSPSNYDDVTESLPMVFDYLKKNKLLEHHNLYNINIPPQPKGVRITRQGGPFFSDDFEHVTGDIYKVKGKCVYTYTDDPTLDTDSIHDGYISIMPLNFNRTEMEVYHRLSQLNQGN